MGKNNHMIRDADSEDAGVLAHLIRESFRDVAVRFLLTPEDCPSHPSNCTVEWIESDQARGVEYFILSQNGEPIGCVGLESPGPDMGYIEHLSVLPKMRRKGFGHALFRHALRRAKAKGIRQVTAGIIAEQTELRRWYSKIGFVEAESKNFPHLPFLVSIMKFVID
jgi:GNAT superfamily N-acetyltransferase